MLALQVKNLSKKYRDTVALDNVSLQVEEGSFFGLLGPNGAGKTTLIGILSSIVNKTSGTAKVFTYDTSTQLEAAKNCLGVVPQEFNFNIFEKVSSIVLHQAGYYGIPRSQARKRVRECLEVLDLWNKRDSIAGNLSGGMKRRLMIARALVHHPRILILDEPTAGVDIEMRRSMWNFLRELNAKGTTIILTTHYLEEAERLCREIAIIDHGKIVEHSPTRELIGKLHLETFIFDLTQSLDKEKIKDIDSFEAFTLRLLDPHTLEVDLERGQTLNSLFEGFKNQSIVVNSMRNKANRLEELFVRLLDKGKLK